MTAIIHILQPGAVCEEKFCPLEHIERKPEPTVTLWKTTWQTKDGRVLDVSEMGSRHALHTYHLLHRNASRLAWQESMSMLGSPWAPQGEMAQYAWDREMEEMHLFSHRWLDRTTLVKALWARACSGFAIEI